MGSRLTGYLRQLQVQARTLELMALFADAARSNESSLQSEARPALLRPGQARIVERAVAVLRAEAAEPIKLATLAARVGTNRNTLNQLFSRVFGTTVSAYRARLRIQHAQALLSGGQFSIAQVAERVGYQYPSSFATAFRRYTGRSPRRFQPGSDGHGRTRGPRER
jgi:AraC-like DNA-binding protein